jgi:hypothetical protein
MEMGMEKSQHYDIGIHWLDKMPHGMHEGKIVVQFK